MLREGIAIGADHHSPHGSPSFTDKQIELLKTFADQAVIAIENVRLFKEIQERNAELREALEHQTATSRGLGIISRSPTDVQPVLDAIVESAARVCGIDDVYLRLSEGNTMVTGAHYWSHTHSPSSRSALMSHASLDARARHAPHSRRPRAERFSDSRFRRRLRAPSWACLFVSRGNSIGVLTARRTEVRPFTEKQIKLLETFADQAVIAIENVRLFNECKESLEQQTATSEILGVIASSPTEFSQCLMRLQERRAAVRVQMTQRFSCVEGDSAALRRTTERYQADRGWRPTTWDRARWPRLCSSAGRSTFKTFGGSRKEFPESGTQETTVLELCLLRRYCGKGVPSG